VHTSVIQEIYKAVPTAYDLYTGYNTKQCLKTTMTSEAWNINQFETIQRKVLTCSANIHCVVEKLTQPNLTMSWWMKLNAIQVSY